MMTDSLTKLVFRTQFAGCFSSSKRQKPFVFPSKNSGTIDSIFAGKINRNKSQQSTSSVFQNRSKYWTSPVEAVALLVNRKPNKEFDLPMKGSQKVLFWFERTIISLQCFINLIRRKQFNIEASLP